MLPKQTFKTKFIVDPQYLAIYAIQNSSKENFVKESTYPSKNITTFQDIAFNKSKYLYRILSNQNPLNLNYYPKFVDLGKDLDEYLKEIIDTNSFKKVFDETSSTVDKLEKEWKTNFSITSKYIERLGINIMQDYKINVVHPTLKAGSYHGNSLITWAYRNDFPNYNTIYIWHEILHSIFERSDTNHAIIELITDNEMRRLLNGDIYPPFKGHDFLSEKKMKMNKQFQKLLEKKNCNILDFRFS